MNNSGFLAFAILIRAALDIIFGIGGAAVGVWYVTGSPLWWYPLGFVGGAILGLTVERLLLILWVELIGSIAKTHGIKVD